MPSKSKGTRYIEAVGRRKTSVARVRIFPKGEGIVVNGRDYKEYFPTEEMQKIAEDAFRKTRPETRFSVTALIKGGGIHSQSEALRHGLSRALIQFDQELRKKLKKPGFLKRDPRVKERRKFGLKKARRAPQWAKR
ncbi:MAG: 30S ribosomal protein S9 [Candidatus Ryanbacteria bacterium RIFCSPHIGHO2_12_FULL_47_12b]|uniref:Small ribosomal subunit protein uS9 n=2 Tax=Candidatus Ryaniibacteriota TaxID=1817914 RepID=A0A1G2H0X0_9BACT|nr:MAG: 30S ribosomal protein S9 [Parcubacteria group bacterium GW2011_GWA2_47_10b]KKU85509.1 MAG: 30S ribosomal protein S9 [Parcubacteria group bacterium GW2011_GWA1_47_9]OGZ44664.1 MAG: 30S ribosomal protein S9 [Candidatus Ryanbacteria bacterium RIFCSPHIGHO2_01_FULL_48_80]OGZ48175.1 MAG: 30S ribosomal protein S9 [Candidatus Ryanbacteria bacterium RIFCSPHIGHO2_02_FULL_47_25]OGZ51797.1 MAG: 30S ribosomal protein S9 [Candidatus Ryanbacteria bacterium RIFCSPLOWO2_01_FULL_47_79]OGZ51992.1 MAG: 30